MVHAMRSLFLVAAAATAGVDVRVVHAGGA